MSPTKTRGEFKDAERVLVLKVDCELILGQNNCYVIGV
jgi:hypothetical protein